MKMRHKPETKVKGKRLGRHVEHDSRSLAHPAPETTAKLVSVKHKRHCPPFDQGDVGSCTGNATAGACMTDPIYKTGRHLTEKDALAIYEDATRLDDVPGQYPPDDTGSSGLAAAKAAQRLGLIKSYKHAFTFAAVEAALAKGPGILGIDWYEGFDSPIGPDAELRISGEVRGGHEIVLDEINFETQMVGGTNSWGSSWGNGGRFTLSFDTLKQLLRSDGDFTVLS